jgi:acetoin utilization deacetylase AcuC-like enzyme
MEEMVILGIVKDDRYLDHKTGPVHPESPRRLRAVYQMLMKDAPDGIIYVTPRMATLEELEMVHTPSYIDRVLNTAGHNISSLAPDTPTSSRSYMSAVLAVGGCLMALESIMSGQCQVCFSLVRPPGHHALPGRAGGFCIFNNLAICAMYALKKYSFERILIVDFDVHHGNGINDIFYQDPRVMYISTHDPALYPYSGDWSECGEGMGAGYTINMPVSKELNDVELYFLYRRILDEVMDRFSPQALLIGAGFDAHRDDPIGRGNLSGEFFRWITSLFIQIKKRQEDLPIIFALEGGYDPEILRECVKDVIYTLVGEKDDPLPSEDELHRVGEIMERLREIHSGYGIWIS